MTDIIIQGIHGRMGRALCTMIEARTDCRVVAGVDAKELPSAVPVFPSLEKNTVPADVLIDFSNPDATQNAIEYCRAHKLPCVICTTGLSEGQEQALRELSKTVAVFKSANMSLGVNLLIELAKQANAVLGTDFDVEIIEKHHHNKLDAPSGTALMIADELCGASPVPYHYVYDRHAERRKREPTEIGIHACLLYTSDAADDLLCVDLGGTRIIKKKTPPPPPPNRPYYHLPTSPPASHQ